MKPFLIRERPPGGRLRWRLALRGAAGTTGAEGGAAAPDLQVWRDAALPARWRALRQALTTVEGQRSLAWGVVFALMLLDILVVGQHALTRHFAYHTDAFDLGNMDQAVWNTLHGHFFRFTNRGIDWLGPPTRLAIHVEPVLLLIAPLYLIHSGAETLLALQTVALALGAVPLFALALRRLPDLPLVGIAFVVAYLCAPELLGEALWDFHPVTLATPLVLAALYAYELRRYGWLLLAGALAAACKEDVALALVPLGLLIALRQGRPRLGVGIAVGALAWTTLCFLVIMPHFNAGASAGGNAYWYRYANLGSTPVSALANVLRHPRLLLSVVLSPDKLGYLAVLLRTGGGLGIFAPVFWSAGLPELAINLLSAQSPQYSGFYQYNAVLLPVLLGAGVYGVAALREARLAALAATEPVPPGVRPGALPGYAERLARWWGQVLGRVPVSPRWIAPLVVIWLLVCAGWNLQATAYKIGGFWAAGAGPASHEAQINALLARIPPDAVVAATDTLDPHLTDRVTIYLMPDPSSYQARYVAVDLTGVPREFQADDVSMYATMLASGRYRVVGSVGSVVVLERVGPPLASGGRR